MNAAALVKRHDKAGKTHALSATEYFDVTKNAHMAVGHNTMHIRCLWSVHGDGLCPGVLMSIRFGDARFYYCDQMHDPSHSSLLAAAHNIPPKSVLVDVESWNKCLRASNQELRQPKHAKAQEEAGETRATQAEEKKKKDKSKKKRK